jgi:hypothetical protein
VILLIILCPGVVHATPGLSVDVCFMVADLKYNARQGVKICEIQQSSLSLFNGDTFRNPAEESIHKELLRALSLYNQSGWVVAAPMADKNVVAMLGSSALWQTKHDIIHLLTDQNFMQRAKMLPADMSDLSSYQGFLYINGAQLCAIYDFEKRFPGIIVLDKSSFPFWIDKYLMTQLFAQDPVLTSIKPKWGNYKKNYTTDLAARIADDLNCDMFVIKPRGEFLGNGVIIVSRDSLDEVLSYIITKTGSLAECKDPAYAAWQQDSFDSFIVEEFVASDSLTIPHLHNKTYQPTMRVAFLLVYHQQHYYVHFLGEYWKTPPRALDEAGNFMQQNKDICEPPYYCEVAPQTVQAVRQQLTVALPILHRKMMESCTHFEDQCCAVAKKAKIQLVLQEHNLGVDDV